ncbi:MAG: hypothetical protein Q8P38_05545 [Candidatus Nanopelagicales bacterium]|nr:hypothetical protein [Candidatus Nanopelagicales bacterium]
MAVGVVLVLVASPASAATIPTVVERAPGPRVVEYRDPRPCRVGKVLVKVRAPKRYRGRLVRKPVVQSRWYWNGRRIKSERFKKRTVKVFIKECPLKGSRGETVEFTFRWGGRGLSWSRVTRVASTF